MGARSSYIRSRVRRSRLPVLKGEDRLACSNSRIGWKAQSGTGFKIMYDWGEGVKIAGYPMFGAQAVDSAWLNNVHDERLRNHLW